MGLMAIFRWLSGQYPQHRYHKTDPAWFLVRLRQYRPDKLIVERLHDDLEVTRWRISFTVDDIFSNDPRRVDHYSIMFSAQFVPATFRPFIEQAKWDDAASGQLSGSAWFDKRGTVNDPAKISG